MKRYHPYFFLVKDLITRKVLLHDKHYMKTERFIDGFKFVSIDVFN
jgi:hypothetical protein